VAAASQTRGAAAALRDRGKYRAHAGDLHPGHTSVPASVEPHGHLGRPIMRFLRTLNDIAWAHSLAVTRRPFLATSDREVSVALVHSQGFVHRSCVLLLVKVFEWQALLEADTPFLD
jgi:hypothetical protein